MLRCLVVLRPLFIFYSQVPFSTQGNVSKKHTLLPHRSFSLSRNLKNWSEKLNDQFYLYKFAFRKIVCNTNDTNESKHTNLYLVGFHIEGILYKILESGQIFQQLIIEWIIILLLGVMWEEGVEDREHNPKLFLENSTS